MGRAHRQFAQKNDWFFNTWNADKVRRHKGAEPIAFGGAPPDFLAREPDAWVLHPGESWHGFGDLEDGYCMLDPIKVSVVTPGWPTEGLRSEASRPRW